MKKLFYPFLEACLAGKLILLPNLFSEEQSAEDFFSPIVFRAIRSLDGLIAESEKEARRYLRKAFSHEEMNQRKLALLNEHSDPKALNSLLEPIEKGETWGLVSDAGLAAVADPGSDLVRACREKKIEVTSLGGTSSLMLALQLSGFSGQSFQFHGYLPREEKDLMIKLKELEQKAKGSTQIWIEAPYRTQKMVEKVVQTCQETTLFCVALELALPSERVICQSIGKWKKSSFTFGKEMAVFLLYRV